MSELWQIVAYTVTAGAMIPIGGATARIERIRPNWLDQELRHGVIAFGAGVLLSAIALVLVPEGIKNVSLGGTAMAMLLGGFAFLALDEAMQRVEELEEELKAQDQDKDNSASGKDKETTGEEKLTIKTEEIEGRAEPRRLDPNRPEGSENWREKRFNGLRYSIVPLNERGSARAVFSRSPRRCNRAAPAPGSR